MSSILDAVNVSTTKAEFTIGKLPTEPGEVSIMTLEQAFGALTKFSKTRRGIRTDPTRGYNTSTFYVYAIDGNNGVNSTLDNLQVIDFNWYKQLNKPIVKDDHWISGVYRIVGGPLNCISYVVGSTYHFSWYYTERSYNNNGLSHYLSYSVPGSVCVAVVRAH